MLEGKRPEVVVRDCHRECRAERYRCDPATSISQLQKGAKTIAIEIANS